jgi:hypothetical protein
MLKLLSIACVIVLGACSPDRPARVTGNLSQDDLSRIAESVRVDLATRQRSGRIKSMDASNGTVEVWYADKRATWGEAGYILKRATNGWKITTELSR